MLRHGAIPPGLLPAFLVSAVLLGVSPAARAQFLPPAPDPSDGIVVGKGIFTPYVNAGFDWSDNLLRENTDVPIPVDRNHDGTIDATIPNPRLSSLVTEVAPRLSYMLPYSNSRLNLVYTGHYRDYSHIQLPEKFSHGLNLQNLLVLSNGMSFDFTGDYQRSVAESAEIDPAEQRAFATTPFHSRRFSLAWRWSHPSRWGTVVTVDDTDTRFLQTRQVLQGPAPVPFFDYERNGVFVDGTWLVGRQLELYGGIGTHRTDQDRRKFNDYLVANDEQSTGSDVNGDGTIEQVFLSDLAPKDRLTENAFRFGLRGTLGTRYSGTLEAGYTKIRSAIGSDSGYNGLQVRISIDAVLTDRSRCTLELGRQPIQALVDRSSTLTLDSARLSWSFSPGDIHTWGAGVRYLGADYGTRQDATWTLDGSWRVRMGRRNAVGLTLQRAVRSSAVSVVEFNENRISLDWTFGWF